MTTIRASAGSIRQQVSSAARITSRSVGRVIGNARPLEAAGRQGIDPERDRVHPGDQSLGRQVGEADADDVAVALVGDVEDGEPGHHRALEVGLGLDDRAGR